MLKTKEDVLALLGAKDFRSITKEQITKFVSNIPNMDSELAKLCIEQFPEFKSQSIEIINFLTKLCNSLSEKQYKSYADTIKIYETILSELSSILNNDVLTFEQKNLIIDKMIYVSNEVSEIYRHNSTVLNNLGKFAAATCIFALGIGASLLGVNIKDFKKLK